MQSSSANFFSNFVISISLFAIVAYSLLEGKNTVGTITAALLYSQKFRAIVSSCADTYKSIIVSFVSSQRIKDLFDKKNTRLSLVNFSNEASKKSIAVKDLTVSFIKDAPIIKNLNFEFEFPSLNLIKGENGSGKSTLLNVLSGVLTPSTTEEEATCFIEG